MTTSEKPALPSDSMWSDDLLPDYYSDPPIFWNRKNLLEALRKFRCRAIFEKRNGEIRTMLCTLKEEDLPDQGDLEVRLQEEVEDTGTGHIVVWDLEKEDWRAFRVDSLIDFKVQEG